MCGEGDIFSGDFLTDSQLVEAVNASTHLDPVVPAWDAETEKALQSTLNFDQYKEVKE